MNVKSPVTFLLILFACFLLAKTDMAAARQNNDKREPTFDDAAVKIEQLIDSNDQLAQSMLKHYEERYNALSLNQKITYQKLLTSIYITQEQYHLAKQAATDGLALTLKLSSPSLLISKLHYDRGFANESLGEIELATKDYENGLELAKSLHNNVLIANGLVNLGAIYYLNDRYKESLIVLNDAYNIAKKTDNEELKGYVNSELGILYVYLERHEQAMGYYQQAYQHYKNANNIYSSLNALANIGFNHLKKKEYEQAIIAYKTIIEESQGVIPNDMLYRTHADLSIAYLKKKNPDPEASYRYLLLSKQYIEGTEQYDIKLRYYSNEAYVLFALERFDDALASIARVEDILVGQMPLGLLKMERYINIINLKSKIYFKQGDYQQAYHLQEQRLALTQELRDKSDTQSIAKVRLTLEAKAADLHKQVLKNKQTLQKITLLAAEKKQAQQKLYLFYITVVALILAWLLIKLAQSQRKLHQASSTDMLTGIANRRKLMKAGGQLLQRAKKENTHFSVVMIDIDHFKKVNDQFGHHVGDQVLKKVAELGEAFIRKTDVFGRLGGEEFVIFLPNTSAAQAKIIAERFRATVEHHSWHLNVTANEPFTTSISMGIACNADTSVEEKYNLTALIHQADQVLYLAKKQGRNQVCSL